MTYLSSRMLKKRTSQYIWNAKVHFIEDIVYIVCYWIVYMITRTILNILQNRKSNRSLTVYDTSVKLLPGHKFIRVKSVNNFAMQFFMISLKAKRLVLYIWNAKVHFIEDIVYIVCYWIVLMSTAVNLRVYDQTCAYTCAVDFPPVHLLTGHLVCVVTSAMISKLVFTVCFMLS
jgi:hypothetical protein